MKHIISSKRLLTLQLNTGEKIYCFGTGLSLVTGLQLLAFFGAEGYFRTWGAQDKYFWAFAGVGVLSTFIVVVLKLWAIRRDMRRGVQIQSLQDRSGQPEDELSTEIHTFWVLCGAFPSVVSLVLTYLTLFGDDIIPAPYDEGQADGERLEKLNENGAWGRYFPGEILRSAMLFLN